MEGDNPVTTLRHSRFRACETIHRLRHDGCCVEESAAKKGQDSPHDINRPPFPCYDSGRITGKITSERCFPARWNHLVGENYPGHRKIDCVSRIQSPFRRRTPQGAVRRSSGRTGRPMSPPQIVRHGVQQRHRANLLKTPNQKPAQSPALHNPVHRLDPQATPIHRLARIARHPTPPRLQQGRFPQGDSMKRWS